MSVDSFVALHAHGRCAALVCQDATLVQPGSFFFGRLPADVPRLPDPLLLAWPLNNYWNTNFPLSQPGVIRLRWGFLTAGAFEAADLMARASQLVHPPIVHPAFSADGEGRLIVVEPQGVIVNHVKRAADGRGIVARLINLAQAETVARIRPGNGAVRSAWVCGTLEDDRRPLPIIDGMAEVALEPRLLTLVRLIPHGP